MNHENNELGNGTPGGAREIASSPIRNIHAVINQKANVYIEKDTEGLSHNVVVKLRSFDSNLRDIVKATPGRRYDAQRQVWIVSKEVKVSLIQNLLNSGKVEKVYDDSGEARKVYEENSVVVSDLCMRVVNDSTLEFKRPDNTTVASRVGIMPFVTKKSAEIWSIPAVKFQELSALLQTSFGLSSTFLLPEGVQSILCKDDVFDNRQNFARLDVFANRSRNINNGKLLLSTKQALRIPYNEVFATIETAQINVLILTDFLNEPSWLQLAKDYLNRGGALWNCGVFKIGADVISSLEGYDVVVVDLINIDGNASADVERIFTVLSASPNIQRTIITVNHSALKFQWFEKVFHYLNTGLFTPDKFKQRYTQTSDNFLELETILKRKCAIDLDSVKFSGRKYFTIRWIRMPEYLESSLEIIKNTHIESNSKDEALLQIGNAYKFESVLEFLSLIVKIVNPTKEHKLLVLGNSCTWLKKRKLPDEGDEDYDPDVEDDVAAEPMGEPEEEEDDDMTPIPMTSIVTRKSGLNSLVPNEILRTKIRDMVDTMNFIRYHGSRLLNLYVVQMCSEGQDLGLLTCGYGGILRHFFVAVCNNAGHPRTTRLDENVSPLADFYRTTEFEFGIEFPLNTGISSTLNSMVASYETNLMNYITTTTVGRVRRWLMHLLELEYPDCFKVKKRSTPGANYCIMLLNAMPQDNDALPELPEVLEKFAKKHDRDRIMRALRAVYKSLAAETVGKSLYLDKEFLKEYWYKFFHLQYHILNHFTKYSEADAQARLEANRRGKGLRLYTMVPLAAVKTSHVFFDGSGLSEVVHWAVFGG
ncbi:hypothetical protein MP638_001082 [Amoeboaphelidium occidentale]|nr:hypothetical protein MP638_001082 [Amoeboaphelidium occidentale]